MNTVTQAKHTPGPWKIYEPNPAESQFIEIVSDDTSVAMILTNDAETDMADARLIAAAPDLLAAAEAVLAEINSATGGITLWPKGDAACGALEAAVAKATGEPCVQGGHIDEATEAQMRAEEGRALAASEAFEASRFAGDAS